MTIGGPKARLGAAGKARLDDVPIAVAQRLLTPVMGAAHGPRVSCPHAPRPLQRSCDGLLS